MPYTPLISKAPVKDDVARCSFALQDDVGRGDGDGLRADAWRAGSAARPVCDALELAMERDRPFGH
jgi:hypothetical protein